MNPYEAFKTYTCLKLHFKSKKYDYIKYNGKAKIASVEFFNKRKDQWVFEKLSKNIDPFGYILSNVLVNPDIYINDLVSSQKSKKIHLDWMKRNESLTYTFKNQLKEYEGKEFNDLLMLEEGKYPELFHLYLQKKISLEVFVILCDITECAQVWNKGHLKTDPFWGEVYMLYEKYKPFVNYDEKKFSSMILSKLSEA